MPEVCTPVRPILKWAGGKRQLLPELRPFYPRLFNRYFEPFLGSAAVFLDLHNNGRLGRGDVRLSDINADVIGCYRSVRDEPGAVVSALRALEASYRSGGAAHFYDVRDQAFNPARRAIRDSDDPAGGYTPSLAAMLIFPQSHGIQRSVPRQRAGGIQRPGRALRQSEDLRRGEPVRVERGAIPSRRLARRARLRRGAGGARPE
jgi:hypothetical protein